MYLSDFLELNNKGHVNFDFIDVFLDNDNRLFIDPCLIERNADSWSKDAALHMNSYFDQFFNTLRSDNPRAENLFAHAREQNATKLGYGNGRNGKGKTAFGLQECLSGLYTLANDVPTISCAQDIPVFVEGFAEDCMSDLLTNILHDQLNRFTAQQMDNYGRRPDDQKSFWTWNALNADWELVRRPCWLYKGKELLLVPKWIVRRNFLFSAHQYLCGVIIERIKDENGWHDSKKIDIWNNFPRKVEHWEYKKVVEYTKEHPDALDEYHKRMPKYYNRAKGCMTDFDIDEAVYIFPFSRSA